MQTAIDLANHFTSIDTLKEASLDEFMQIEGIGKVVAESIYGWFVDEDNLRLLDKFIELGVAPQYTQKTGGLVGKNFVVTGTLQTMSRDEAADRIRSLGDTFQTSVGKDTTYLVAGGKVGASKLAKAEKYGTAIISEDEFTGLLAAA